MGVTGIPVLETLGKTRLRPLTRRSSLARRRRPLPETGRGVKPPHFVELYGGTQTTPRPVSGRGRRHCVSNERRVRGLFLAQASLFPLNFATGMPVTPISSSHTLF